MENEQTKGRSWNGYVCPGCRNVFRVAGDFVGDEVMCPSCQETLRLPKKSADAPPPAAVKSVESVESPAPAPVAQTDEDPIHEDVHEPAWRTLLTSPGGRKKLSLALGIPLLLSAVVLMLRPAEESPETGVSPAAPPADTVPIDVPETAAPVPENDPSQITDLSPEVLENEPPPELPPPAVPVVPDEVNPAFVSEVRDEPVTTPAVAQVPEPIDPEHGLVDAVPATPPVAPPPAPQPPAATPPVAPPPVPVAQPPAEETSSPPATRHHSVVRGDTLSRIARKYDVDPKAIMRANGMKNDIVRLGAKLVIPPADP